MTREQYVRTIQDLLSGDPNRVRDANRAFYRALVTDGGSTPPAEGDTIVVNREADLALAEMAQ